MRLTLLSLLAVSSQALANPGFEGVDWMEYEPPSTVDIDWTDADRPVGIVNGTVTTDFPQVMAVVAYWQNGQGHQFCSATKISADFVVTAAHCAEAAEDYLDQGATIYVARTNNIYETAEDGWFDVRSGGIHIHPGWPGMNSQEIVNDIALMQTSAVITGTDGRAVLNDETIDSSWFGRDMTFVGFGITDDGLNDSGIKRVTSIPVGQVEFGIVYSYDPNTNVCSGDSGGAAFEVTADGLELAGVNSFVFQQSQDGGPCDGGANGAARIDSYIDWIRGIVPDVATEWDAVGDPNDPSDPNNPVEQDPVADVTETTALDDEAVTGVGCGCSTGSPVGGGLIVLGLLPLLRRRSDRR